MKSDPDFMDHVMIDLETWSNTPDSVVVQIGAAYFDPETGEIGETFEMNVDAGSELNAGFAINADTLYWWFSQDPAAQAMAMGGKKERIFCLTAWNTFNAFLINAKNIWSHASFDAAIVINHFNKLQLKPNYSYRAFKDLRTLQLISHIDPRPYKAKTEGILHSALDDCKVQIEWASDAWQKIYGV